MLVDPSDEFGMAVPDVGDVVDAVEVGLAVRLEKVDVLGVAQV